jgi:hypothetical protein
VKYYKGETTASNVFNFKVLVAFIFLKKKLIKNINKKNTIIIEKDELSFINKPAHTLSFLAHEIIFP